MPVLPVPVLDVPAAPSEVARRHFARLLELETDCADVHAALRRDDPGFVLLDVRSPERYAAGHLPGAVNLPHGRITARTVAALPGATVDGPGGQPRLAVVYCSGPHCNGADRAAVRLAELGHPVKKMLGGVTGWRDEGFDLER